MSARRRGPAGLLLALALAACGEPDDPRAVALATVKATLDRDLGALVVAVRALRAAAPAPDADGWSAARDPAAVAALRARWREARAAYERIEGAIAVLFPTIDYRTDERYDGQLAEIVARRDDDLFDGDGVIGMHAVERILWADAHPARVVTFERALPGYVPAAYPATAAQAAAFRDGLCATLVRDVEQMQREFTPLALDPAAAFRGVVGSMEEQVEKVDRAASAEEESRYAQATLFDLRNNLAGARDAWAAFRPWVLARNGAALAGAIDARFAALGERYAAIPGDAIPPVPEGWNPDAPTDEQQRSAFGQLRAFVLAESDPQREGSLVHAMNLAADLLDIPRLP